MKLGPAIRECPPGCYGMHTLFIMQFNISQTEPFFNMNQGTPESTGKCTSIQHVIACVPDCVCAGGFSFMQMTLNEDESSSTNIQDFFSQFGKTDTSSHSETAGIDSYSQCAYLCTYVDIIW